MNSDRLMKWMYGYNTTKSSADTNGFGSHAPGIIKAMQMLDTQFENLHASSPSSDRNDVINNNKMVLNTSSAFAHLDLLGGSSSHSQQPPSETNNIVATNGDEIRAFNNTNMKRKKEEIVDDGRTHSLSHNKNGPYTCPKCNKVLATSQKFASHASIHYKSESEEEKKKRYMSRIRKRPDLRFQKLNDGTTTFVPIASVDQSHAVSVSYNNHNMSAPAPPLSGVKVKLEPADN
ncbi:putative transcription factor C2H2 family [Medicago truncatula]|uniref:Putative transcription factor C2H2 family n=1 Tax=Medicago truncatula TaxID=3880 RepID=A0A396IJH9_MEDTR|nr:uncharacterized protein LOC112421048 [Medicago truncatula]RHN63965.1 putative transcription factor C2H2 family [Medicago truncatula]